MSPNFAYQRLQNNFMNQETKVPSFSSAYFLKDMMKDINLRGGKAHNEIRSLYVIHTLQTFDNVDW